MLLFCSFGVGGRLILDCLPSRVLRKSLQWTCHWDDMALCYLKCVFLLIEWVRWVERYDGVLFYPWLEQKFNWPSIQLMNHSISNGKIVLNSRQRFLLVSLIWIKRCDWPDEKHQSCHKVVVIVWIKKQLTALSKLVVNFTVSFTVFDKTWWLDSKLFTSFRLYTWVFSLPVPSSHTLSFRTDQL